ncbi:RNA polymerase sigma factor RpoE [Enhygromyxa salina]|uniref:RNA polymerase sigma factor n=1 Tax=Enhygromyxa salina TaxID=215803 RepID=A0A0C1Z8J2_9BACT|nr:RNA polymerase sigma factor [Enhygromyxa salina]KIG13944.1 RNA polymerase sigma factor RpoE [Enhygromyxa salina]
MANPHAADEQPAAATGAAAGATVHALPQRDMQGLVARARRHDPAAQRQLFELHKTRVCAQVQRMTGDPATVDDLVQEVFIAAFANLDKFRGDSQLHTWLYRIVVNKARNWWDSEQRRRRRELRASQVPAQSPNTPHDQLEACEHREQLYAALGELSPKLREAFVARVVEGMSLLEASEALEVPVSTVSYRTRRAEELLCQALGVAGFPTPGRRS